MLNNSGQHFFKVSEQTSTFEASQYDLGTCEMSFIIKGGPALAFQEGL